MNGSFVFGLILFIFLFHLLHIQHIHFCCDIGEVNLGQGFLYLSSLLPIVLYTEDLL